MILVSVPTDHIAINTAKRIAFKFNHYDPRFSGYVGEHVGYSTIYESNFDSNQCKIKVVTDEVLYREILLDPLLNKYSIVLLSKRELCDFTGLKINYNDLIPQVLSKIAAKRKNFKIVISTSRMLDVIQFKSLYEGSETSDQGVSVIELRPNSISKRLLALIPPVVADYLHRIKLFDKTPRVYYLEKPTYNYIEKAVETAFSIHNMAKIDGDIQVFLTGSSKSIGQFIEKFEEFKAINNITDDQLFWVPFHNNLSLEQQEEVFKPTPVYKRKIVLSALMGDTCMFVPDIVYVIDCCFEIANNTQNEGMQSTIIPASKETCNKRAYEAWRSKFGKCFRLCTKLHYKNVLPEHSRPMIIDSDLSLLVLKFKALGWKSIQFNNSYPKNILHSKLANALEILYSLGAIDDSWELTPEIGMKQVELPVDPKVGRAILASNDDQYKCTEEILSLAAVLEVGGIFQSNIDPIRLSKAKKKLGVIEGDHITIINIFNTYTKRGKNARK